MAIHSFFFQERAFRLIAIGIEEKDFITPVLVRGKVHLHGAGGGRGEPFVVNHSVGSRHRNETFTSFTRSLK